MKASQYLIPTEKDDPGDAVVVSHKLMIRAGLVRKSSSGLYSYLPLGLRVLKKIEAIIRDEMNSSGALEFELPILTPSEIWKESGRWEKMGKEMFRLKDRHDMEACLGPTHEESFCSLMKPMLRSYKDLPINVYQIHTKFRDEIRPRFGVIRSREFRMKDAYSFHLDDGSLDQTYQTMRKTYRNIFSRMGLSTIPVQADSGNMGGSASEEFMVVSQIGEESLTICSNCGYAGNVEKTPVISKVQDTLVSRAEEEFVSTPGIKTIEQLTEFFGISANAFLKAVVLSCDGILNVVFLPGDREINENKIKNLTGANEVRQATFSELETNGLVAGFIGPGFSQRKGIELVLDSNVSLEKSWISGANQLDGHKKNVILKAYQSQYKWTVADITQAKESDPCPSCNNPLQIEKGIEVGHIFKLGQKYSKAFGISVLNPQGKATITTMGCYGIGVNRCMATIIEQCNDEKGILWPVSVAPFTVCLVSIVKTPEDKSKVEAIYKSFVDAGIEILWDDRDLGPGFKLKDSELIGFPVRITIGKGFLEKGEISILNRKTMQEEFVVFEDNQSLVRKVQETIRNLEIEIESKLAEIAG